MATVRVFAGANAAGNPCEIVARPAPDGDRAGPGGITRCYSWRLPQGVGQGSDQPPHYAVACFSSPGGSAIQCCGHGLLAAGWHWFSQGVPAPLHLIMGGSSVQCHPGAGKLWVHFDRLFCRETKVPHWAGAVFGSSPLSAATAGPDQGYLVLEWPVGFPLQTLPVPSRALACHTRRAVIACCRTSDGAGMIHFRYFAPQYGVAEDTATGSAMRILMDYCQQRYQRDSIEAFQCSGAGGVMSARSHAGRIAVGGRVECMSI